MPYRKVSLASGEIYHVFTKSIAEFKVFNSEKDYARMMKTIDFYRRLDTPCRFSEYIESANYEKARLNPQDSERIVDIVAYCLMPSHLHLVVKQLSDGGISRFINLVLKSYSKYFNLSHNRKGPLWEGRFKNVLVETDEQLLHLTRYVHLNPVTAFLISQPEDWKYSSYTEYVGLSENKKLCNCSSVFDIDIPSYKQFVNNRIGYQRELAKIKMLVLE
jgi:putative transposase